MKLFENSVCQNWGLTLSLPLIPQWVTMGVVTGAFFKAHVGVQVLAIF